MSGKKYDKNTTLFTQQLYSEKIKYNIEEAIILFIIIEHINNSANFIVNNKNKFVISYDLRQYIEKFGNKGMKLAINEV